jgi:hypothetical protein
MVKRAVVVLLVGVFVAFFFEARLRRAEPSEEARAIGKLAAIARAQSAYASVAGKKGYAGNLATLFTPCPGMSGAFLSPDFLADHTFTSAYEVSLRVRPDALRVGSDCNGAPTYSGYYATATPRATTPGTRRAFAIDEQQTIWSDSSGRVLAPPFRETATVKPVR